MMPTSQTCPSSVNLTRKQNEKRKNRGNAGSRNDENRMRNDKQSLSSLKMTSSSSLGRTEQRARRVTAKKAKLAQQRKGPYLMGKTCQHPCSSPSKNRYKNTELQRRLTSKEIRSASHVMAVERTAGPRAVNVTHAKALASSRMLCLRKKLFATLVEDMGA